MNETTAAPASSTPVEPAKDPALAEVEALAHTPIQELEEAYNKASAEAQRLFRETLAVILPKVKELISIHTLAHDIYVKILGLEQSANAAIEGAVDKVKAAL